MWYRFIRPLLFALDPELSHDFTLNALKLLHAMGGFRQSALSSPHSIHCMGLTFANPIGLAAGLDKNGICLPIWQALGFGFVEVGTVTPKPQVGNPKPRLFRLISDRALINRMGFNNKGVDSLVDQLKIYRLTCPIGVNIGKNKDTSLTDAPLDYRDCFEKVYPYADYVTVNLSSPNTPGLRALQHGEMLKAILLPLKETQQVLSDQYQKKVPLVVKISPDLQAEEIKMIVEDLMNLGVEGIIATNTTLQRPSFLQDRHAKEEGGLSGEPLFERSTEIIKQIYQQAGEALAIIAVGGIFNAEQAKAKFVAGAKLVQLYTGLIYQGPGLVKELRRAF
ncbi:MAG: quinone-dependent dihydroorotate dehydrogenase [Candidatus Berkiellales bacterium]